MVKPYISVVIPAYNEAKNFKAGVLDQVHAFFVKQAYDYEIIVSDDGSTDGSADMIDGFCQTHDNFRLLKNPHKGKAFTVRSGVMEALGTLILFTDFDQATPPEEVVKLIPFLESRGYDIAIGSREIMGSKREEEPWYRHLMGKVFNIVVQVLAIRNIHDTQCGFKMFKTEVAKELFMQLQVYKDDNKEVKGPLVTAFDVELLFLAHKRGYKIAEVPVYWHHVKSERVSPIKDSYRMFIDVLKIRISDLMGAYAPKK